MHTKTVYPCTYRELTPILSAHYIDIGISLYLQGTLQLSILVKSLHRYIPVPTGNSSARSGVGVQIPVYPCTYRELAPITYVYAVARGISLYLQGTPYQSISLLAQLRYIPVPTGNSFSAILKVKIHAVYPCTYRELSLSWIKL